MVSQAVRHMNGHRSPHATGLALLVAALACVGPSSERDEIRLGLLVDRGTPNGAPIAQAAELAVAEVRAEGGLGIGGRRHQVRLLIEETENTPEDAARAALTLINQGRVAALVGSHISRNAMPEAEIADAAGVPFITTGATHPGVTAGKRHAFRVSFTNPVQSRALARFAVDDLGAPPTAILYDAANAYSRDFAETFRQAFEAAGGDVVAVETYTSGTQDFRPQLRRLRAAGPRALLLPSLRAEIEPQLRQIRELGIDATLLGVEGWLPEMLTGFPEAEGAFATTFWHRDLIAGRTRAERFIASYEAAYGQYPLNLAALTYDAFGLLFQAITSAGSGDSAAIREQLAQIEGYRGVTADLTFRGTDGDPETPVVIIELKNGEALLRKLVRP